MKLKKQLIINEDFIFFATGLTQTEQEALNNWHNDPDNEYNQCIHCASCVLSNNETLFTLESPNVKSGREAIIEFFEEFDGCEIVYQD